MADKEPGGEEVAEAEVALEEGAAQAGNEEEQQQDEPEAIRTLASEMGWAPKDQFKGDPNDWKPASDFIKAGRDINRSLSRELKGVRDQVSRMERVSSELLRDKLAERDSYWAGIQAEAVKDGDQAKVNRAMEERIKIRDQRQAPTDETPPETADFMERNKAWFGTDPLATVRARQICQDLAKEGLPYAEQLRQTERAIRKEYPEHFAPAAKAPAAVQTGGARNANPSSRVKGFADMPAESQKMARSYLEDHGIPLEKYAESYWADQANQRRVG